MKKIQSNLICNKCIHKRIKKVKNKEIPENIFAVAYCNYLDENLYYLDRMLYKNKNLIYLTLFSIFIYHLNNNKCVSFVKKQIKEV